jgi:hypothetical protein
VDGSFIENTAFQNLADLITLKLKSRAVEVMDYSAFRLAHDDWYGIPGEVLTQGFAYQNVDVGFDVGVGRVIGVAGVSGSKDGAASATVPSWEGDRQSFTQKLESYEADSPIHFFTRGQGYHNCLLLPTRWGEGIGDCIDLAAEKQVTLDVRTRSGVTVTNAKNRVLIERPATAVDQLL